MQYFHLPVVFCWLNGILVRVLGLALVSRGWKRSSGSFRAAVPHESQPCWCQCQCSVCSKVAARTGGMMAQRCLPAGCWHASEWGQLGPSCSLPKWPSVLHPALCVSQSVLQPGPLQFCCSEIQESLNWEDKASVSCAAQSSVNL